MMKTGKHTKLYDLLDDAGGTASTPGLNPPRKVTPDLEHNRIRRELDKLKMRRVTNARVAQIIAESNVKEELAKRKLEQLRPQPKRSQQANTLYQVARSIAAQPQQSNTLGLLEYISTHPFNTPDEFERVKKEYFKTKGSLQQKLRRPEAKRSRQAATLSPYQGERTIALLEYIRTHPESVNTPEEFEKVKEYIFKKKGTL